MRFRITNKRLADDATRGGFKVIVAGSDTDRERKKRQGKTIKRLTPGANTAQGVINDFMKRTKIATKVNEYARVLPRDGDLLLNPIVDLDAGLIWDVRRAPATTIKRNSDEYGEFPDIQRAFSQIDPRTQYNAWLEIGPPSVSRQDFALFQMNHIRWLEEESEMYGTSHYAGARLFHLILSRMEKAAAIRREYRSVPKYAHEFPESTQEAQILKYARDMRLVDQNGNPTRNSHLLSSFFGTAKVKILDENISLDQMGDIRYFEDLLWLNLGVPKAILTSGQDMNRDVLKVQYPHYLETLDDITNLLEYGDSGKFSGIRDIIDLQLLLSGINPDSVSYDVVWANKTNETPLERTDRVQKLLGANGGTKIIPIKKAVQIVADDIDVEDVDQLLSDLEEEEQKRLELAQNAFLQGMNKNLPTNKNNDQNSTHAVTDVLLEDRPGFEDLEVKAKETVLRFFYSIFRKMKRYEPITDSTAILDDFSSDDVLEALDEAWDEEVGKYRVGITKWMTEAGMIGSERAVQLILDLDGKVKNPNAPDTGIAIKPKIAKSDIRDDLLVASGERVKGIEQTTRNKIQDTLSSGFEENIGWKQLIKQLEPIILDENRAEMIAKSELSWAYNRSALRVYQDANFTKVEWSAVIDQRTCSVCKNRNGKMYKIEDWPGLAHPRCRCTPLPVE